MTTDEAKAYLLSTGDYTEDDFQRASNEDVAYELAEENEWVCNYFIPYPVSEAEMKTAIDLAIDHKHWENFDVDHYLECQNQ